MQALGASTQPITFTGTISQSQAGWWNNVAIIGQGEQAGGPMPVVDEAAGGGPAAVDAVFHYVHFADGGYNDGDLYLQNAHVEIDHSDFVASYGDGIYGDAGGVADISDSRFENNGGFAVRFTDGSVDPVLARLQAAGNSGDGDGSGNGVALGGGTLIGDHLWENSGLPYILIDNETIAMTGSLTIRPGVTVKFDHFLGLRAEGLLSAVGTADLPIIFTGAKAQPGWWNNVAIVGSETQINTGSVLSYVTLEYGGYNDGDLYVQNAVVRVSHSVIRQSGSDGIYLDDGSGASVVAASQLLDNAGYGVENRDATRIALAANNWWGSNNGPTSDQASCNPGGDGSRVSQNVVFQPFLTKADQEPGPLAPSDMRFLSVTPQQWYAAADGHSRVYVTIVLRDGSGNPMPGRTVHLASTLGDVSEGGVTDVTGKSFAYLVSDTAGDTTLTATLAASACESAQPAQALVTFTTADTPRRSLAGYGGALSQRRHRGGSGADRARCADHATGALGKSQRLRHSGKRRFCICAGRDWAGLWATGASERCGDSG